MTSIVTADVGGTHARFAQATVVDGAVHSMADAVTLPTADYPTFAAAWEAFVATLGPARPRAAAIAVAAPVGGDAVKFTNNPWTIEPGALDERLGIERHVLVNDFGAIGHAVMQAADDDFLPVTGPSGVLPTTGVTTIVGPGTGLGVALVVRRVDGFDVVETEGGHIDFAPLDAVEDAILTRLRGRFGRVSVERVVSGPGIQAIYETLAQHGGETPALADDRAILAAALANSDPLAVRALERFCLVLGSVTGDLALAHGANSVVVAGGLGLRLRNLLGPSGFAARFVAKGRYRDRMAAMPVRLITHPQPGLLGAAAAFARTFPSRPS